MISIPESTGATAAKNPTRVEDGEYVEGLRTASPRAWAEIMSVYRPKIYATALRVSRNHHDAEDITQETFIMAFRAADRFRGDSSLSTWLHAIANNLAIKHYWYWRRRKKDKMLSFDSPIERSQAITLLEVISDEAVESELKSEKDYLLKQVEQGMTRLSEKERNILVLRDRQEASYEEISRVGMISVGTVKSRIHRAREHLRAVVQRSLPAELRSPSGVRATAQVIAQIKSMSGAKNTALGV